MASAEQLRIAHSIEGKVIGVDDRVQDVGDKVQAVDRKLDDTNRSSCPILHMLPFRILNARAYSQGTYSATIFYDGSRLQIHQ